MAKEAGIFTGEQRDSIQASIAAQAALIRPYLGLSPSGEDKKTSISKRYHRNWEQFVLPAYQDFAAVGVPDDFLDKSLHSGEMAVLPEDARKKVIDHFVSIFEADERVQFSRRKAMERGNIALGGTIASWVDSFKQSQVTLQGPVLVVDLPVDEAQIVLADFTSRSFVDGLAMPFPRTKDDLDFNTAESSVGSVLFLTPLRSQTEHDQKKTHELWHIVRQLRMKLLAKKGPEYQQNWERNFDRHFDGLYNPIKINNELVSVVNEYPDLACYFVPDIFSFADQRYSDVMELLTMVPNTINHELSARIAGAALRTNAPVSLEQKNQEIREIIDGYLPFGRVVQPLESLGDVQPDGSRKVNRQKVQDLLFRLVRERSLTRMSSVDSRKERFKQDVLRKYMTRSVLSPSSFVLDAMEEDNLYKGIQQLIDVFIDERSEVGQMRKNTGLSLNAAVDSFNDLFALRGDALHALLELDTIPLGYWPTYLRYVNPSRRA